MDLINNKMDMLTVQEKFINREVSPKIARLMSNFEEPIQNCSSEVVFMEVDRLPVQLGGWRTRCSRSGRSDLEWWSSSS